jgi:hypothetical protein
VKGHCADTRDARVKGAVVAGFRLALVGFAVAAVSLAASSAVAAPLPGTPQMHLTAADNLRARQAVLQLGDFDPPWRRDPRKAPPALAIIPRCPGSYTPDRSSVTITGSAAARFTNDPTLRIGDGIAADASLFRSAADFDKYWTATVRPAFATCLAKLYDQISTKHETKLLAVNRVSVGPTGTDRVAAYRTVMVYMNSANSGDIAYRTDVFLGHGRALIHLQFAYYNHECPCTIPLTRTAALRLIHATQGI